MARVRGPRRFVWTPSKLDGSDAGVSLIEVVIASVLFGLLAVAALTVILGAQKTSVIDRNRVAASNLGAREMDLVREEFMSADTAPAGLIAAGVVVNAHPLAGGVVGDPLVLDGVPYTVSRSVSWNLTGYGSTSACEGGATIDHPTMAVTVSVTWPHMTTVSPIVTNAAMAPAKSAGVVSTAAFVAVRVNNAAGDPNPGRTVQAISTAETASGLTDSAGCAIVQVNPAAGVSGSTYTIRLADAGYVDVSGTEYPEVLLGQVRQGQLNSNAKISYDLGGSLTLRPTGAGLTAGEVVGSPVSLYNSAATGSDTIKTQALTGATTTFDHLWPGTYGAFFGTSLPPSYPIASVVPGGSATLDVPVTFAEFTVAGSPGTSVVAVSSNLAPTCASIATGKTIDPAAGRLVAGPWSFFAVDDSFGCSPGPSAQALESGATNPTVVWQPSSLSVTGAPAGSGDIWAVSANVATAAGQVPSPATRAYHLSDGSGNPFSVSLPAGDYYVFAQAPNSADPNVPAGGTSVPAGPLGLVAVRYGVTTSFTWPPPLVHVTGVPSAGSSIALIASPTPLTLTCSQSYYTVAGSPSRLTAAWPTSLSSSTYTGSLPAGGPYYVYLWKQASGASNPRCVAGGSFSIGSLASYSYAWNGSVTSP